jgi:iron(III) transport system substrate-binding protein
MKRPILFTVVAAVLLLALISVLAEYRPSRPAAANSQLVIYSTTDTDIFEPIIEDFTVLHPEISIVYELMDAQPLYDRVTERENADSPGGDLILSSAMDLQVMLVNDGYALPHTSVSSKTLPDWAKWRDEAYGITFEPAVMVFNKHLMGDRPLPQSRQELLTALRTDLEFWKGRIGTYDISTSSVGYLLASQDDRRSGDFDLLFTALGNADVVLSENTSTLLAAIGTGELVAGYNLLGSYARAEADKNPNLVIVYPQDYTLAVSRTAIILKSSANKEAAHTFMEYLLSLRGQKVLSEQTALSAVRPEIGGRYARLGLSESLVGPMKPIALGPGLLVYLDHMKRQHLLSKWNDAIQAEPEPTEALSVSTNDDAE